MKAQLQDDIFATYPALYGRRPVQINRSPIALYGIECGDGWAEIVRSASGELEVVADSMRPLGIELLIFQVKAKYRRLLIHTSWQGVSDWTKAPPEMNEAHAAVQKIMAAASDLSIDTCQKCGDPVSPKPRVWREEGACVPCRSHWFSTPTPAP